jgi:hypothetical protein
MHKAELEEPSAAQQESMQGQRDRLPAPRLAAKNGEPAMESLTRDGCASIESLCVVRPLT